jgi:diamine N-acetyltransferase
MKFTIRQASETDFEPVLLLINEFAAFQKATDKVKVTLEQMKQANGYFRCLVAENEHNEIVGYTTFYNAYYTWTGKAVYLDDLYVRQTYRRQQIGRQLMQEVFDIARSENCTKVRWQVSHWNKPAIGFYKNLGAAIDDTELNCDLLL